MRQQNRFEDVDKAMAAQERRVMLAKGITEYEGQCDSCHGTGKYRWGGVCENCGGKGSYKVAV